MKKVFLKAVTGIILLLIGVSSFAQIPSGYYDSAEGLEDDALRQALHNIIDGHTVVSYGDLWDVYEDSDMRSDGKVWDTYSDCNFNFGIDQCGNYSNICDCFNREHTVPQSWFNESSPMVSDAFHVIPTDGKVNGYRSSYSFGECDSGTTYGLGKLGACTYSGFSGTVFEPADEYKGDMARIYFYMATRYMDVLSGWSGTNQHSFSGNDFTSWTRNMMLDWHHGDPVSQKEIDRNNAVHDYQHNRNPFVDNPIWADAIWDPNYNPSILYEYENSFEIYPNPTNTELVVNLVNSANSIIEIKVVDLQGRLIMQDMSHNPNRIINVSHYPEGVYFVQINFKSGAITTERFVVIH